MRLRAMVLVLCLAAALWLTPSCSCGGDDDDDDEGDDDGAPSDDDSDDDTTGADDDDDDDVDDDASDDDTGDDDTGLEEIFSDDFEQYVADQPPVPTWQIFTDDGDIVVTDAFPVKQEGQFAFLTKDTAAPDPTLMRAFLRKPRPIRSTRPSTCGPTEISARPSRFTRFPNRRSPKRRWCTSFRGPRRTVCLRSTTITPAPGVTNPRLVRMPRRTPGMPSRCGWTSRRIPRRRPSTVWSAARGFPS
ncbi:MAG: hypothetical protein M5R36_05475 [Deltaproteobacteria bacterium]|nr:hypothetical protein [Deltaproteobacteria bacterium]